MLSICIPVYNFDVRALVDDLHEQALRCGVSFEIIVMDDASDSSYLPYLQQAAALPYVRLITLNENIGRAKIRNAMVKEARYPYVIFMDCDSATVSNDYIAQYLPLCQPNTVVYGGRRYKSEKPSDATLLHWKYGVERESLPASKRQKHPNFSFCTNNFLIDKAIFDVITFSEQLEGYGHEDTFFGLELLGHHILIQHIDNPLIHLGLETAEIFLKKTENGITNLHKVELMLRKKYPDYVGHSKLMRSKIFLQKWHLLSLTNYLFKAFKPLLKRNLLGRRPSLFVFDLYKLGTLCLTSLSPVSQSKRYISIF
ncbi:MAG: glycosyltransferase [Dysgonamonadaceae bacterium]|nr:glycosyltransferase [Dysgonamonadaceae bacterium]